MNVNPWIEIPNVATATCQFLTTLILSYHPSIEIQCEGPACFSFKWIFTNTGLFKIQSNLDLATLAVIRKYVAKSGFLLKRGFCLNVN